MVQEAKGYPADGSRLLYRAEADLGRRGFVAAAPYTGQNTALFIKTSVVPLSFELDNVHFHHAAAIGRFSLPGLTSP
jgi:exodeoxyribonuclease III